MKKVLSVILAAGLLLYPFAAVASDYGSQTSQSTQVPPVAQTLVREGDFAIKLAAMLDIGSPKSEAEAEEMLAKAGIVPSNGWLSDYPMTPEIVGQLQSAVTKAASEGRIAMNSDQATRGLYSLAEQMNLPTPAGPGSGTTLPPAVQSNPAQINNYYYDQGPPVITYYPPPEDYFYLYSWIPYPVFWFGFWFPGFYICDNFTTVTFIPFDHDGHHFRRGIVTNRIIDHQTGAVAVVDPLVRTSTGGVRPMTTLRVANGRTFSTMTELRREAVAGGFTARIPGRSSMVGRTAGAFSSPEARRSATSIYSRSVEHWRSGVKNSSVMGSERRYNVPNAKRPYTTSPRSDVRTWGTPARSYYNGTVRSERQYVAPSESGRSFNAPSWGEGRRFSTPTRDFRAPVTRGGSGAGRSFIGSGWRGGGSGFGRAFSGTAGRGRF